MRLLTPDGVILDRAAARVIPHEEPDTDAARLSGLTVHADSRGRITVTLRPGSSDIELTAPGCATLRLILDPPCDVSDLGAVFLYPGRDRAGQVRDAKGRPVAGAKIRAREPGSFAIAARRWPFILAFQDATAVADDDGSFVVRGAPAGIMALTAEAPGLRLAEPCMVAPGAAASITMQSCDDQPVSITGVVRNAVGPVQLGLVDEFDSYHGFPDCGWQAAADGSFRIAPQLSPRARYRVVAWCEGREAGRSTVLCGTATGVVIDVATATSCPPTDAPIRVSSLGRVQPMAATPRRGRIVGMAPPQGSWVEVREGALEVTAIALDGGPAGTGISPVRAATRPSRLAVQETAQFADDGTFRAIHQPPGATVQVDLLIPARHPACRPLRFPLGELPPGGAVTDLHLDCATATVRGRLSVDGLQLPAPLRVVALQDGWLVAASELDPSNRYSLQLVPGRYQLGMYDARTDLFAELLPGAVDLEPRADLQIDLQTVLQRVVFMLEPMTPGGAIVADAIHIDRAGEGIYLPAWSAQNQGQAKNRARIDLAPGQRRGEALLPPGRYRAHIDSSAPAMQTGAEPWAKVELVSQEFTVGGAAQQVVLQVAAALTDSELR